MTIFEEVSGLNKIFMNGVEAQIKQSGTWYLAGLVGLSYIAVTSRLGKGTLFGGVVGLSVSGALGVYNVIKTLKTPTEH